MTIDPEAKGDTQKYNTNAPQPAAICAELPRSVNRLER
jgi:hypothetical protein